MAASPASGQPPSGVVVSAAVRSETAPLKSFVGTVAAPRRVTVGSAVDGRVLEFPIRSGQHVETGQTLAQLRTKTIEIEIDGAKAELQLRLAELEELRNGSRPEEVQLARASLDAAEAMHEFTSARFDRARSLMGRGSVSQDEFEDARTQHLRAAASLAEATNQYELVRQGPRQEKIDQAAARVEVQRQTIAGLEDRLDKYTVRAPFDGYVISEMTQAGAWLQQGNAVAELVDIDPIEVEVYVPESNIGFIDRGLRCIARIDSLGGREFEGEVTEVVPLADARARTFPVKVRLDNPRQASGRHELMPGMLAQVRLPTGAAKSELMVHKDALQLGGAAPQVIKIVDGKAVAIPVRAGNSLDSLIAVEPLGDEQLDEGDDVVVRGNERLRSGQPVRISGRIDPESAR